MSGCTVKYVQMMNHSQQKLGGKGNRNQITNNNATSKLRNQKINSKFKIHMMETL